MIFILDNKVERSFQILELKAGTCSLVVLKRVSVYVERFYFMGKTFYKMKNNFVCEIRHLRRLHFTTIYLGRPSAASGVVLF